MRVSWSLVQVFGPVLAAGLLVGGLTELGKVARGNLQGQERFTLSIRDIECSPPPGLPAGDFLDEVQYVASLPPRLNLLDANLKSCLQQAFALHPWIASVRSIEVRGVKGVYMQLTHREPVLAVHCEQGLRAVDRQGVLLPRSASTANLPVYRGMASAPRGPAGTRWGDAAVEEAARASKPFSSPPSDENDPRQRMRLADRRPPM